MLHGFCQGDRGCSASNTGCAQLGGTIGSETLTRTSWKVSGCIRKRCTFGKSLWFTWAPKHSSVPPETPTPVGRHRSRSSGYCKGEEKGRPAQSLPRGHVDFKVKLFRRQMNQVDRVTEEPFGQLAADRGWSDAQQLLLVVLQDLQRKDRRRSKKTRCLLFPPGRIPLGSGHQ